jgi:DNA-binding response OmpR family regulator
MSDVVVITTEDLEAAGLLRGRFTAAGLDVELLASGESLTDAVGNPLLLIITGGVREPRGERLIAEARRRSRLPVIGLLEPGSHADRDTCRSLGLAECFAKPVDGEEVVARRSPHDRTRAAP